MKYIKFENPELSFKSNSLIIEKQENGWHYKIYVDNAEVALMIYRNGGYGFANGSKVDLTDSDKLFIQEASKNL